MIRNFWISRCTHNQRRPYMLAKQLLERLLSSSNLKRSKNRIHDLSTENLTQDKNAALLLHAGMPNNTTWVTLKISLHSNNCYRRDSIRNSRTGPDSLHTSWKDNCPKIKCLTKVMHNADIIKNERFFSSFRRVNSGRLRHQNWVNMTRTRLNLSKYPFHTLINLIAVVCFKNFVLFSKSRKNHSTRFTNCVGVVVNDSILECFWAEECDQQSKCHVTSIDWKKTVAGRVMWTDLETGKVTFENTRQLCRAIRKKTTIE